MLQLWGFGPRTLDWRQANIRDLFVHRVFQEPLAQWVKGQQGLEVFVINFDPHRLLHISPLSPPTNIILVIVGGQFHNTFTQGGVTLLPFCSFFVALAVLVEAKRFHPTGLTGFAVSHYRTGSVD